MLRLLPSLGRQLGHEFVVLLPDLPEYSRTRFSNLIVLTFPAGGSLIARQLYLNRTVPRICREHQADALLCMGNFGPATPAIPTVVFVRNAYYAYHEPVVCRRATLRDRAIIAWGQRYFRRLSPAVTLVVQTPIMKRRLAEMYGLDPSRIVVIPDAGAVFLTVSTPDPRPLRDPSSPFTFLCLAVYGPHKNQEILLEAVPLLQRISCWPVRCLITIAPGDHPHAQRFLDLIRRRKLEHLLINIGHLDRPRLERAYRAADAAIQPSLLESFGRVYMESMAFDLPILASDRDFAHAVCGNAAAYFDPLDASSVARAMADVMNNREQRERLIANGRAALAAAPTWDQIAARFVGVLEDAAGRESSALRGSEFAIVNPHTV